MTETIKLLKKACSHYINCTDELAQCMICINLMDVAEFIRLVFEKPDEYLGEYKSSYVKESMDMT